MSVTFCKWKLNQHRLRYLQEGKKDVQGLLIHKKKSISKCLKTLMKLKSHPYTKSYTGSILKVYFNYTLTIIHLYFGSLKSNRSTEFPKKKYKWSIKAKKIKRYFVHTLIILHLYFLTFLKWRKSNSNIFLSLHINI